MSERIEDVPTGPGDTRPGTGPDAPPQPPGQAGKAPGGRQPDDDRGDNPEEVHGPRQR
jgi:hypothetical protein